MLGNGVEMNVIFRGILDPLNFRWALYHLILGAQHAPVEIRLVCIPVMGTQKNRLNETVLLSTHNRCLN